MKIFRESRFSKGPKKLFIFVKIKSFLVEILNISNSTRRCGYYDVTGL